MSQDVEHVIIGVDPHKLSATIEVVDQQEQLLGSGRFATDRAGDTGMRKYAKNWPKRIWAVEGANGVGRPLAHDSSKTANMSWTCRPSLPPGSDSSTPVTTARPTPVTRTRSRSSRSAPRRCACSRSMASWKHSGCSPIAANH